MYVAIFILGLLALLFIGFSIGGEQVFKRKSLAALFTSVLAIIIMNLMDSVPSGEEGFFIRILVYSAFSVPVIFIYGIIASIVSDKISLKAKRHSNLLAFLLHVLFGLLFILPYSVLFEPLPFSPLNIIGILMHSVTLLSILLALMFFAIDFILKLRSEKSSVSEPAA